MAQQGSLAPRARLPPSSFQLAEAEGDDKAQRGCHGVDRGWRHIAIVVVVAVGGRDVGVGAMLPAFMPLVLAPLVLAGLVAAPVAGVSKGRGGGTQGNDGRGGGQGGAQGGEFQG